MTTTATETTLEAQLALLPPLLDDLVLADDGLADGVLERGQLADLGGDGFLCKAHGRQGLAGRRRAGGPTGQFVNAYITIFTPNFVLSSARKRRLRQS